MNISVPNLLRAALLAAVLLSPAPEAQPKEPAPKLVVPKDGMRLTCDTLLAPGTYYLEKGIEIAADGVTLDGGGAVLIGRDFTGSAVRASGRKKITIRNLDAERYYHGIRLENCQDVAVENNKITRTAEAEFGRQFVNVWAAAKEAYGAGIILIGVRGGRISANDLQHQQNGISMYSCSGLTVERNNASYESGWGIHLYDSSDNIIQDNVADFCNRIQFRRWGDHVGADSAGLLMVHNSCRNKVLRNLFRCSGDGVFVAGYHGEKAPCSGNLFEENDCSLSPNNAFESTFCEGNIFRKNKANSSNYGFWLGYSWKNEVSENEIANNRLAGVAIEHGNTNVISKNTIRGNRHGIMLWTRGGGDFVADFPELQDSHSYTITGNRIEANRIGINSITGKPREVHCRNYTIIGNRITDNRIGIRFERTTDCRIDGNTMSGNAVENVRLIESPGNTVANNAAAEPPKEDPDITSLPWDVRR